MSEQFDIEQARKQLEELGRRIESGKATLSRRGAVVADGIDRDWRTMERSYQELSRKLRQGHIRGSQAVQTLRRDIDELRHGFSRWAAKVERRFDGNANR